MQKFKVIIIVDGEPGPAQEHTGTMSQLRKELEGLKRSTNETIVGRISELKNSDYLQSMTLKFGSVFYIIKKI